MKNIDNQQHASGPDPACADRMTTGRTIVFAAACGLLAANLYYAQPLISAIGPDLGVSVGQLGFIVTITQIGFSLGLLFIVPLHDRFESRRMITSLVLASAAAMLVAGLAGSKDVFFASVLVAGLCSVGAQLLVPLAAALCRPERQGRVIGAIMAGLLTGIMLARPLAAALTQLAGWRSAFIVPAALLAVMSVVLVRTIPHHRGDGGNGIGAIFRSMGEMLVGEPLLRRRAFYQSCLFASFNIFWTAGPLALEQQLGFNHADIAVFALVGAGGALAALVAGRLADRGLTRISSGIAIAMVGLSFAATIPAFAGGSVVFLAILGVMLDAGTQTNQVLGQNVIYTLRPDARGRVNAIYMTIMFVGGAIGSAVSPYLYANWGWTACAIAGMAFPLVALATFLTEHGDPTPASGET